MTDGFMKTCRERLTGLGYVIEAMEVRVGPFAALIAEISARKKEAAAERFIYKAPAADRTGEMELVASIRKELSSWLSYIVEYFPEEPAALLMKDAGTPYLRSDPLYPIDRRQRQRALKRVSAVLAELHLFTMNRAPQWVNEGKLKTYPYSREWADWSLEQIERLAGTPEQLLEHGQSSELRRIADRFYSHYSDKIMLSPQVFTHGDAHWGNVLIRGDELTLIDWEWSFAATPMRDIAVLLQEEPDDEVAQTIMEHHISLLLGAGYRGTREDLLHDFNCMMIDNTMMMLGWEIELFFRGERSSRMTKTSIALKYKRILQHWKQYIDRRGNIR